MLARVEYIGDKFLEKQSRRYTYFPPKIASNGSC